MSLILGYLHRLRCFIILAAGLVPLATSGPVLSEDFTLTPNAPISEFQNRTEDVRPYDFDAPPQGMFLTIQMAEGFEEEIGFRRTNEIVPVNPTEDYAQDTAAVFVVFQTHQHYQPFKVFGLCYPEDVRGLESGTLVTQDVAQMTTEDETGYLKLFAPQGGWKPGRYKVRIHVGEAVNEMTLIGTMRFTITPSQKSAQTNPAHSLLK